ncbi:MAG: cell division protein SepF, partial [Candidatus Woesearchaeota archaeon]
EEGEEYVQVDNPGKDKSAFMVRSFTLNDFEDTKEVIKVLRTGRFVALVDLKPLKENDVIDLRRAVNKLKSVNEEISGDIAGLSGDWLVMTPHPITIEKPAARSAQAENAASEEDFQ